MNILIEIDRIKQVMGLITEQSSPETTPAVSNQSNENLNPDSLKDGAFGDPYIYIKNKDGDFLTYKCGKNNEICPGYKDNLNSVPWINVSAKVRAGAGEKYINAEKAIKNSVYNESAPTQEEEIPEQNSLINQTIVDKFRSTFYSTYLWHISNDFFGTIKDYPKKPKYEGQLTRNNQTYNVNLVGEFSSNPPGFEINDDCFNKAINTFIKKEIDVNGVMYKLARYDNTTALYKASSIFKPDSTGYIGDTKTADVIQKRYLGIYKV
jgi:hypothetical protein